MKASQLGVPLPSFQVRPGVFWQILRVQHDVLMNGFDGLDAVWPEC
jgi:hypothetical protein